MPDPDPASRKKEKAKTLDPRLKMSGMTEGGISGNDGRGEASGMTNGGLRGNDGRGGMGLTERDVRGDDAKGRVRDVTAAITVVFPRLEPRHLFPQRVPATRH